jgi:hypothetical protein
MAPKHQRKAGSSGTSSAKTSEKEGLLKTRALKRAERFDARRIEAEEHKEAVRPHVPFMPPRVMCRGRLTKETHGRVVGKCALSCG